MSSSPVLTVVLARSLRDFHAWCRETGTSPRDRSVLYASGPHSIRALTDVEVVRYGSWWDRPDEAELADAVTRLENRGRKRTEESGAEESPLLKRVASQAGPRVVTVPPEPRHFNAPPSA